jgi:hypothetical protein
MLYIIYIAEETANREKREGILIQRFEELMQSVKNDINEHQEQRYIFII